MEAKSQHLQVRVTPRQKAELRRRAKEAGQDMSTYLLSRALPTASERFTAMVRSLAEGEGRSHALAEINDFLTELAPMEFSAAVEAVRLASLSPFLQSYLAAMTEVAAAQKGKHPPKWTSQIEGLEVPHFATTLKSLRLHLLQNSPVPFKRRNLFVDATIGARM